MVLAISMYNVRSPKMHSAAGLWKHSISGHVMGDISAAAIRTAESATYRTSALTD